VDLRRYQPSNHLRAGSSIQLVWIGSASTLRGLEQAGPILEDLGQRMPGLTLKVICDRFPRLNHLRVLACPWSEQTEAEDLRQADIGLSWLPDDLWSRGKCALKVLQYMAAGLPVVANPVGLQAELVRQGETGFLVRTAAEFAEAVKRLAEDPMLRLRFGKRGRDLIQDQFGVEAGKVRWLGILGNLCGLPPVCAGPIGQVGGMAKGAKTGH
jgi:glycosyltransferase involved in cell wall biosynthesis